MKRDPLRIAIVGLGPSGLCALERIASAQRCNPQPLEVEVHLVEPNPPGMGIYDASQPDYLVMNNSCGDISLYSPGTDDVRPSYGMGLHDWAASRGYGWKGTCCVLDEAERAISPEDFLPRRVMGEYLNWFYHSLVNDTPHNVRIELHRASAVNVQGLDDGQEALLLSNGNRLTLDHVILTFGHVTNTTHKKSGPVLLSPYPIPSALEEIKPQAKVLVCGMGLVGIDVVAALTQGRGGLFVGDGAKTSYLPSGKEPQIHVVSRSGLPYRAKSAITASFARRDEPIIFTRRAIDELRGPTSGQLDFRRQVLPLLFAEMTARFYVQSACNAHGLDESERLRHALSEAHAELMFDLATENCATRYGGFNAHETFFGPDRTFRSSADYQDHVCRTILGDLDDVHPTSPLRAATETFRLLRGQIRLAIDHKGLTHPSYLDFRHNISPGINRLIAGPPAWRLRQLLALIDAGVVCISHGPAPKIDVDPTAPRRIRVSSTRLDEQPTETSVDTAIRGFLEDPQIDASSSPLLNQLRLEGRLVPLQYGDTSAGSVEVTPAGNPLDRHGHIQRSLWVFGAITEGARYFTHYVPSERRGTQAFQDIRASVEHILSTAGASHGISPFTTIT